MNSEHHKGNLTRFDAAAAAWDSDPGRVAMARAIGDAMIRSVPFSSSMKVMDYGAGTGLLSWHVLPLVGSIVAVDTSPEMLKVLREKVRAEGTSKVTTRLLDLSRERGRPGEFDAVVSSMTLHHVQDIRDLFDRFHEVLMPGGWLAISDLDSEDGLFHRDPTEVHHHGFDRTAVCALLIEVGFVDPSAITAHTVSKTVSDGSAHSYSIFLITARRT